MANQDVIGTQGGASAPATDASANDTIVASLQAEPSATTTSGRQLASGAEWPTQDGAKTAGGTQQHHQDTHRLAASELAIISRSIAMTDPGRRAPPALGHRQQAGEAGQRQPTSGPLTNVGTLVAAPTTNQWLAAAAQTRQGIGQRMSLASDQLSHSLRQLYASASSITDVPPSYHNIPGIVPYYHGRSVGPPPSYDDVINPYAPPPTYQSLFGQMREARKTSRGLLDLLRRLLIILVSTLGCTILIAFMILIPFTMIIVGAIYIDECQIEHIPAFLLVGGLVWASKNIIHCYGQCRRQEPDGLAELYGQPVALGAEFGTGQTGDAQGAGARAHDTTGGRLKTSICESLLNCVLFGWFIAGCVIVFRNYEPDFDNSASARYCHRTVYMYTFWLITSALLLFGLFIGCICCLMVSSAVASRQQDTDLA